MPGHFVLHALHDRRLLPVMLLTAAHEFGQWRIYATRFASVVTYFTEDESTGGVKLHLEAGFAAAPGELERNGDAVRAVVLGEIGRRLGIPSDDVLGCTLKALRGVADPELPDHYRYARRARGRAPTSRAA